MCWQHSCAATQGVFAQLCAALVKCSVDASSAALSVSPEDAVQTLLAHCVMPSVQMLTYSQQIKVICVVKSTVVLQESQASAWTPLNVL